MDTITKSGWLQDREGNKFAPKTIVSSVYASDGTTPLEENIAENIVSNLNELTITLKEYIDT